MDFFGLTRLATVPTGDLSYGNQRKVEMARALAANPELLILDEPAAGLNENETIELTDIIRKISQMDIGIMMIEHDMDMVMNVSPCPFLETDNKCSIYEYRPKACREYPHTEDYEFTKNIGLHATNAIYCPAVFHILEKLRTMT